MAALPLLTRNSPGSVTLTIKCMCQLAKEVFTEVNGKEPELKAIHAGKSKCSFEFVLHLVATCGHSAS